jgi:hypothetical protein
VKKFKQADIIISITLITVFLIISLIKKNQTFIRGYFVTGGWQVISMLVHVAKGWFTANGSGRVIYHWVVFVIISMGLLAFAIPAFFFIYYFMFFAAPFMAIIYTLICYFELKKINTRPLNLV